MTIQTAVKGKFKRDMLLRLVYQLLQLFIVERDDFVIRDNPYPELEGVPVKISPWMLSKGAIEDIMSGNDAYEKPIEELDSEELRERAIDIVQYWLINQLMSEDD